MDDRTRLGLMVAASALALGAAADGLLRVTPWGINAAIWCIALLGAVALLASRRVPLLMGEGRIMAIPALLFGLAFAWRDSPTLKVMDGCGVVVCLGLMVYRSHAGYVRFGGAAEYALAIVRALWESISGAVNLLTEDIGWERVPRGKWTSPLAAAGRGLLLAIPLLIGFGALLASADSVFAGYITDLGAFDLVSAAVHVAVTIAAAWAVAGFLKALLLPNAKNEDAVQPISPPTRSFGLGAVEVGTALALVDLLFLAFVLVQVRYFFGGHQLVLTRPNFTCADYARGGFFELVWAAALALPMLLGAHAVLDTSRVAVRRMFAVLAGGLVMLLLVVLSSAAQRMSVYQTAYGMTELRYYTSAFMVWLAAVFVWFCLTVLRNRRDAFAFGGLVSAIAGVFLLHALNPDATIARANLAMAKQGRAFDAHYAASLSGDAVPELIAGLDSLPPGARYDLGDKLMYAWDPRPPRDWRNWSLSRQRAFEVTGRKFWSASKNERAKRVAVR